MSRASSCTGLRTSIVGLVERQAKDDTLRDGWTREQFGLRGRLEASSPSATDVAAFGSAFRLAMDDCLSVGPTRPTPELTGRDGTVLERPGVALWHIGGHAVVTSVGYLAEIRDGVLAADPEITRDFPAIDPRFDSVHASGSCGNALEHTLLFHARDDRTDLFRWQAGHWQASGSTEGTPIWCGSGRMLTVVRSSYAAGTRTTKVSEHRSSATYENGLQWGFRFRGPSTPVAQYLPTPARPGVSCRQRLIPDAFDALPSGHLFALGREAAQPTSARDRNLARPRCPARRGRAAGRARAATPEAYTRARRRGAQERGSDGPPSRGIYNRGGRRASRGGRVEHAPHA